MEDLEWPCRDVYGIPSVFLTSLLYQHWWKRETISPSWPMSQAMFHWQIRKMISESPQLLERWILQNLCNQLLKARHGWSKTNWACLCVGQWNCWTSGLLVTHRWQHGWSGQRASSCPPRSGKVMSTETAATVTVMMKRCQEKMDAGHIYCWSRKLNDTGFTQVVCISFTVEVRESNGDNGK